MATQRNKTYKDIFEERFGSGSYESGLSKARDIGKSKAQAEFEKLDYERRIKEQEQAQKEAKEAREKAQKDYETEQEDRAKLEAQWKEEREKFDQARYQKGKELNGKMRRGELTVEDMENTPSDNWSATPKKIKKLNENDPVTSHSKKNKKKQNGGKEDKSSFLGDLVETAKDSFQVNVLKQDPKKVYAKTAKEYVKKDKEISKSTKALSRGIVNATNSFTGGALKEVSKKTKNADVANDLFFNERKIGEGGGIDMITSGLGYVVPGAAAYKALNATKAGKALTNYGSKSVGKRLGSEAVKGTVTGAGIAGAEVGVRETISPKDYTASDNLAHVGVGALTGAIADPALYGLGKGAVLGLNKLAGSSVGNKLIQGDVPTFTGRPSENVVSSLTSSRNQLDTSIPSSSKNLYDRLGQQASTSNYEPIAPRNIEPLEPTTTPRKQLGFDPNDLYGFGQSSKNIPTARFEQPDIRIFEDTNAPGGRRPVGYWNGRYNEFTDYVKGNYNQNQLSKEALDDLWTQFARPDEDVNLDQLVDLYTKDARRIGEDQQKALSKLPFSQQSTPKVRGIEPVGTLSNNTIKNSQNILDTFQLGRKQAESITPNLEPKIGEQFEAISPNREPELRRIPDVLSNTQKQAEGNANTFRSKVDRTPQKNDKSASTLRTQFIDDLAPLEALEKKVAGEIASAENSLYKQGRLFRGSPAKAEQIVKEQVHPIIRDVQKSGYTLDDLGDYALAVHSKDVNSQGINSGFTNAEVDDVINKLGTPAMEEARKKLMGVNNYVLDTLSTGDKPVLSSEQVTAMREKYPNYMPLFRSFDDEKIEFASGMSDALSVGSSPIKKLKGSSRDVVDPMESVIKNIYKAVNVSDRNRVASQLDTLATKDTDGAFVRKLKDGEETGRLNVISAMDNGKKVNYEVPPDVYKAMKDLDKESSNTLIKWFQKPASALRTGATLTPEFSMRNFLRDVPQAAIVSESGFNPLIDFPIGLFQAITKGRTVKIGGVEFKTPGELYEGFIKNNGGYGNITSMDRNTHQKTLKKALTEANTDYIDVLNPKTYTSLMKKFANPLNGLRSLADISETGTKVGEFRAATRKGASPEEAAYQARDIMDFGRSGVSIRQANKVVAFMNANVQGKSKLWRAWSKNPVKVTGRAVSMVTIPTIGALVAQETLSNEHQKKIIDEAPRWMKDTFYLIPIPGTNQIARIPKPFDLAYPFSNSIERAVDYIKDNDKEAFDGFIRQGFTAMAIPTMLTGLAPLVEGIQNHSFFRQSDIIPLREQNLEFPDQYDVNTSETAKFLGKHINNATGGEGSLKNFGSPRIVDNTIQGFFGGLGTYVTSGIDLLVDGISDNPNDPVKPEKSIDQQPVAKAFLVNQSGSNQSLDDFYKLKEKVTKSRGSAKHNDEKFGNERQYKQVNKYNKGISEINKEIRAVQNSLELTAKQKKQQLDILIKERNEEAYNAVRYLKTLE